jgi:hypothetical protein
MSHPLYSLLAELDSARLHYSISRHRLDSVMVTVTLVGERLEIVVFGDGHMEVSRFLGDEGVVGGAELVREIIEENCD